MLVQISKHRSSNYYSAVEINETGATVRSHRSLCIEFDKHISDAVSPGQIWTVNGSITKKSYSINGFKLHEEHVAANEAELIKPNTALIETWLRKNIDGVGQVKARKLARMSGLDAIIEAGDPENALGLSEVGREQLLRKFPRGEYAEAIKWLSSRKISVKLANSISSVWRDKTIEILEDNPFRLMQFGESFKTCCRLAEEFGITVHHPKYKAALAVHIIEEYLKQTSSTFIPRQVFENRCSKKRMDAEEALKHAAEQELVGYLQNVDGYQLEVQFLLEAMTGLKLRDAFLRADGDLSDLAAWETSYSNKEIAYHLREFEQTQPFALTDEQRSAVAAACKWKVISLSGGAGTGKTTILKALQYVLDKISLDTPIYQVALSGRAAQRMWEATGREASTIAKFCIDQKNTSDDRKPDHAICIIDEASMVDLFSMHNLLENLPLATRFIFVGDVDQLPPVGGGLVFHELMKSDFPSVTLTQVKRQGEQSGIHKFATEVRNEHDDIILKYTTNDEEADCSLYPSVDANEIQKLFIENGGSKRSIILTAKNTKKNEKTGVQYLNTIIQKSYGLDRERIKINTDDGIYDFVNGNGHKFYLDDQILITKNDYSIGIRNGDLGFIETIYEHSEEGVFGVLNLDGREIDITLDVLDKMQLGYAITIHKSQGSQWQNVILVLDKDAERMIDKTLLYTSVTRAENKLIICCEDDQLVEQAIVRGPISRRRHSNLLMHLSSDRMI